MNDAVKKPKMAPWLRILLLLSLAANLAVVGIVAGTFIFRQPHDRPGPPRGRDYVFLYTRAFDEVQREELGKRLRAAFERDREEGRAGRRDYLTGYRDALALLRAEPFDPEAFDAALGRQSARAEARQVMGQQVLIDYVAALPADSRRAYADRLEEAIDEMANRSRPPRP